ncbi:MAG: UDP-galactopyranose mutase [Bacilli bacterium]|nr:UDP-galactopyranose mutase [Bacilli bacterium]MBQ3307579.1 UDP-galactopyranose mutase [Bacilli bacterium]
MNYKYDFVIVGAGLAGSTLAYLLHNKGYKVKVIDKREHIAGNCYTENKDNINIHVYGPHIFHTNNKEVWDFVNKFADFNNFINEPVALAADNRVYNMPFNMNTFSRIFNIVHPDEAKFRIDKEIEEYRKEHSTIENLEDQAINMVGTTIYELLIKGYTEKQWGKSCTELSPEIIKRLPLRFTYNNNYFNDKYQGIPEDGYTNMIRRMLQNIEVVLNYDYKEHEDEILDEAKYIIYTGRIDEFFDYIHGKLEYRSLNFVTESLDIDNFQGNAVVNYTTKKVPYTRVVEHKHFNNDKSNVTYITYEFPSTSGDPFYPLSDKANIDLYNKYKEASDEYDKVIFAGRLGKYKYFDMDDVIEDCFKIFNDILNKKEEL